MGLVPIFSADVSEDGERLILNPAERNLRRGHLRKLAGQRVDVVVRKHRSQRSVKQLRWWKGIAVPLIAQELGYDKHDHEALASALLAECFGTREILGRVVANKAGTSDCNTAEMSELMEWAVRWAASEHGIVVPLPNDAERG